VNYGPRSNFLYIAIPFYFYLHYLLSCILLSYYHSICAILCLQQTGEIDNLIVSWEQSSWLCCVQVSRCCWGKTRRQAVVSGALVRSVTKLASITLLSLVLSPTGLIYLGFITDGRLAAVLIIPSLGVPNWSVIYISTPHHQGTSLSQQGAGTEIYIPRNSSVAATELHDCFSKITDRFRVFYLEALYRRRGCVRGPPGGPHHPWARPGGGARQPMGRVPSGPPLAPVRSSSFLWAK
jgi:hypothetical protein